MKTTHSPRDSLCLPPWEALSAAPGSRNLQPFTDLRQGSPAALPKFLKREAPPASWLLGLDVELGTLNLELCCPSHSYQTAETAGQTKRSSTCPKCSSVRPNCSSACPNCSSACPNCSSARPNCSSARPNFSRNAQVELFANHPTQHNSFSHHGFRISAQKIPIPTLALGPVLSPWHKNRRRLEFSCALCSKSLPNWFNILRPETSL